MLQITQGDFIMEFLFNFFCFGLVVLIGLYLFIKFALPYQNKRDTNQNQNEVKSISDILREIEDGDNLVNQIDRAVHTLNKFSGKDDYRQIVNASIADINYRISIMVSFIETYYDEYMSQMKKSDVYNLAKTSGDYSEIGDRNIRKVMQIGSYDKNPYQYRDLDSAKRQVLSNLSEESQVLAETYYAMSVKLIALVEEVHSKLNKLKIELDYIEGASVLTKVNHRLLESQDMLQKIHVSINGSRQIPVSQLSEKSVVQ